MTWWLWIIVAISYVILAFVRGGYLEATTEIKNGKVFVSIIYGIFPVIAEITILLTYILLWISVGILCLIRKLKWL